MLVLLNAIAILEAELNELPRRTQPQRDLIKGMLHALTIMRQLLHAAAQAQPQPKHFQDIVNQHLARTINTEINEWHTSPDEETDT